ncbi:MAG: ferritin-like domain-containing protein [Leptospiraceae bacterium]|nr:ferritin-like domain-containing protein [Leptospiraceae bacterium]MCP5512917.1 ferritin-like domain-containing protein [Leptospiraceae bacterium]
MNPDNINLLFDMAGRNVKVAMDLLPSALSGFVFQDSKKNEVGIHSGHNIMYDWTYSNFGNPEFMNLYKKAKKGQWDSDDLAWDTDVDPFNFELPIFPERLQPMYGHPSYNKLDNREKGKLMHSTMSWLLSNFLHGEQGALYAAAMTVEATPWMGAKYYGSTQVMDEARHVEVFHKYLDKKLNKLYSVNDNLFVIIHALTSSAEWDIKFLGMQIMIEGLALGAFGLMYKVTREPLLKELLKNVISDEARHVHYGVEALRDYYTKEVSDQKRRDREDWAFEVSKLLRDRFLFLELYEENFHHAMKKEEWVKMVVDSEIMSEFRRTLFSRLIPNLKAIGLLSDRIKPKYEELGLLRYENGTAADRLTLNELLAA